MQHTNRLLIVALAALCLVACEKPEPTPGPSDTIIPDSGSALVLNEGTWGGNNASLTRIDLAEGTLENNWFRNNNGRNLGDLAQDLVIYGSKAYVTVSESGSLEVIDTATGHSTHVDLSPRYPRCIAAYDGKLYISCYKPHSVIRIDTATLQIEATCELGDYNPEGLVAAHGMILVASSNVSDEQGNYSYDNKVYAINIASFSVSNTIEVGSNPQKVMLIDSVTAVVNFWGDYASAPAGSAIVDMGTMAVTQLGEELTGMTVANGYIYGYRTTWAPDYSSKSTCFIKTDAAGNAYIILPNVNLNAYAIGVHPVSGNIYVGTDGNYSSNGDLYCFTPNGVQCWKREVGMLPSKIVFF